MESCTAPRRHAVPAFARCCLALLLAPLAASHAATVTVGNGGCQYIGLQFALDQLESQPGPHTLKLKSQTIAVPAGLVLDSAGTSYSFIGGHASCADASPTPGQRTVLDASGGNDGTAMAINGTSASLTPVVLFRNVTIRGGNSETGPFANPEGGGLEIRGRVSVRLQENAFVEENASGKGGGVYIRGDNASERAELWIMGGSSIAFNQAQSFGGGIYCDAEATIFHDSGDITANSAQYGGGAYLHDTCGYDALVNTTHFTGYNQNTSTSSGGGLYTQGPLTIRGSASAPFWFLGNQSGGDGGGLVVSGPGGRNATLYTTVFMSNSGQNRAGVAITVYGGLDLYLGPAPGHDQCAFLGVGLGACSALVGNISSGFAAGGVVTAMGNAGSTPMVTVRDTAFLDNRGPAMLDAWYEAGFDVEGSVFRGNTLSALAGEQPALLRLRSDDGEQALDSRLAWSTVTGNIAGSANAAILDHDAASIDLRGSILHNPGLASRSSISTGPVSHGGCLLVHDSAGYPGSPAPIVASPGLQSNLAPSTTSAALDVCGSAGAPAEDFRGNPRAIDQPGEANVHGPVDLGAIERPLDAPPAAPQLRVYWNGSLIVDGSTSTLLTNLGSLGVEDGTVFRDFIVRNEGAATLTISGHTVSGSCAHNFAPAFIPPGIDPGGQGVARLVFDPVDVGVCEVEYEIVSNDSASPYTFRVRGTGIGPDLFADGFE